MTTLTRIIHSEPPEHRFTVETYLRMVKLGILTADDKVELIDGRIVQKMSRNSPHEGALQRIFPLLLKAIASDVHVRVQSTIRLPYCDSAPEPDVSIVPGAVEDYDHELPEGKDAVLVVEIADSSLYDDRKRKASLYAGAAIPIYWIVNLEDRRLEEYTIPTGPDHFPAYKSRRDFYEQDIVALQFSSEKSATFRVVEMLPAHSRHSNS